ncbi:MAG: hypothetical protein JRH20_09250 [Deltaproteobacteria bacterium]|nr:hypothetical protein [Deltaproteobacteria bacterium]
MITKSAARGHATIPASTADPQAQQSFLGCTSQDCTSQDCTSQELLAA